MKPLDKYVKQPTKQQATVTRSVLITQTQQAFLTAHNLNLSDMVRDMLEDLMRKKSGGP